MRFRPGAFLGAALLLLAAFAARDARAAADVHRLSLMLSGIPTQVNTGDFNDDIDRYNTLKLDPRGWDRLGHLQFTWGYDAELRYFVRPNFAVAAGVSQIKVEETKTFLPALAQGVEFHTQLITAPVHIGAAYYLQPYNQGDFQARAFIGGGLMQYVYTRASFAMFLTNPDSVLSDPANFGPSFRKVATQDGPGYYVEGGGQMFFASRYSVLISAMYRSGELRGSTVDIVEGYNGRSTVWPGATPGQVLTNTKGRIHKLDPGGIGVRMSLGIGF